MKDYEIGARVYAILNADDDAVRLLGFGRYLGLAPMPAGLSALSHISLTDEELLNAVRLFIQKFFYVADPSDELCRDTITQMESNPKIELDSGETVWGYQCWWGAENAFEEMVAGRQIIHVSAAELRREENS